MKTIDTLVEDIYAVIKGNGGWDDTVSELFSRGVVDIAHERFSKEQKPRDYLSLSMLGTPCPRKIWYKVNMNDKGEELSAEALGTFFYGDLLEVMVIALAKAAGHKVEGLQEKLDVCGVQGHGDCIIDGWVVDVKSASRYGFEKFRTNGLKKDDPFGYISQLSSYLYGYREDPRVVQKNKAAFLVVQKDRFKLALDVYDLTEEIKHKESEVRSVKTMVEGSIPSERIPPKPEGKSGNEVLDIQCSYCEFKKECWPKLRTFIYSTGPKFFTKVVNEPKVKEIK